MSEFLDRISRLSPQRLALLADELNERLQAAERGRRVPLAIVGIGCRMPGGVHSPEEFWKLLGEGGNAVTEVPSSRWNIEELYDPNPDAPGKMATRWGGFIDGLDQFDPKFFGIAPAEATCMDPQQRLLLETSWEALEHAGIAPAKISGTPVGVFVGICNGDYGYVALNSSREEITPYFAPGLSHAIAAGRISYVLGLQGPSLAVDTSCSASLVAVHLACQSLRLGECEMALAGGVNLIFNPDVTIALSQSKMMAPDGRCKAFSDSANGFVRSEGCGMIVLKRLPDAIRDRNRILAVIRGSACNQDGRSNGLTAPNGPSQEAVIAAALADAGMQPDAVDVIEAHGTGTALGDPIEIGALGTVFAGESRKSDPLFVGSVKTNLGHLESAAGIAGLIKLVLAVQHGKIPASLHLDKPSTHIEWDRLPIKIPTKLERWKRRGQKRVGGVSSFGFSGTNAHVIVEEYAENTPHATTEERPFLFTLSAKTQSSLAAIAVRLRCHLADHPTTPLGDIAHTLNAGRSHFEYRAAMVASSNEELNGRLDRLQRYEEVSDIPTGRTAIHSPRVTFVFGNDPLQGRTMSKDLYDNAPAFREAVRRCEEVLGNELNVSLDMVWDIDGEDCAKDPGKNLAGAKITEFVHQYALAELWSACGIEPAAVFGTGVGGFVAACVAGVFDLHEGLQLALADENQNSMEFDKCVRGISYREPRIPFILLAGEKPVSSADYWLHHSHADFSPSSALAAFAKEKNATTLYIGNTFALGEFSKNLGANSTGNWLASIGSQGDSREFLGAAAALYVLGCELQLDGFYRDSARTVSLPTYPFERERYWIEAKNRRNNDREKTRGTNANILPFDPAVDAQSDNRTESDDWIYDLVWEEKPLTCELPQHRIGGFRADLIEKMTAGRGDDELLHFVGLNVRLDSVCSAYIVRALQKMGVDSLPQGTISLTELCTRLRVAPPRRRLFERLLTILIDDGLVERVGESFRLTDLIATNKEKPTPEADLRKLEIAYPRYQTEMNIVRRCAENLSGVLLGTTDPVHLLFPNNSMEETEHVYRDSPVARFYNETIGELVRIAAGEAVGRVVRILEIGAGTGATTASVLPGLREYDVDYSFTDLSPVFMSRARGKFSDFTSVNYRLLDIEKDPIEQGFEPCGYDIVIAANVLHATADLRCTISHVKKLLPPGGLFFLLEGTRTDRCVDLTFGLTDGWWRFVDFDLRPEHPLISAETWTDLLHAAGMASVQTLSYLGDDSSSAPQALIVAQAPTEGTIQKALPQRRQTATRNWVVLADESGVGGALYALLTRSGQSCEVVRRPHSTDEIAAVFNRLASRMDSAPTEIVYLWGIDVSEFGDPMEGAMKGLSQGVANTLVHLIQAILRREGNDTGLWMVTRGAQAVGSFSANPGGTVQSLMWGIGRSLDLEAPMQYRALIDLDPAQRPEDAAEKLFGELLADDREDQIAFRGGKRLVARLKSSQLEIPMANTPKANRLGKDSSYLITGGLGGIGLRIARWAATQGAGHLILLGKTGTGSNAGQFAAERLLTIEEIQELGVKVTVIEGDVASATEMSRLFQKFEMEFPPLRGIFHAATDWNAAALVNLTEEQIETMLRPKVLGTWILHEMTKAWNLDFFLTFSSAASLLGAKGMAHYAAANQFLNSFAHYRRALGLPMLSVNWGTWDVMRMIAKEQQNRFAETGILTMPSEKVLSLFKHLTASKRAQVMIASIDWEVLSQRLGGHLTSPLLENFSGARKKHTDAESIPLRPSLHAVIGMAPEDRTKFIEAFVLEQTAQVLGFRSNDLPSVDVPLTDIGLDSLMAVDLKNRLQVGLGQELSSAIVFDYPTIAGMVGMLDTMLWAVHCGIEDDFASSQKDEIRI